MKHSHIVALDSGTREGRKSLIAMARRELRIARAELLFGDHLAALEAIAHAERIMRVQVPSYIAMRLEVMHPQPKPRAWWMIPREEREAMRMKR